MFCGVSSLPNVQAKLQHLFMFFGFELTDSNFICRHHILCCRQDIFQTDCGNKENVLLLFSPYNGGRVTPPMVNLSMVKFHCGLIGNRRVLLPSFFFLFFFMAITRKMLFEVVIKLSGGATFSTQRDDK